MKKNLVLILAWVLVSAFSFKVFAGETCVDLFMDRVHIDKHMRSNPLKVQDTLEHLAISDFEPSEEIFADLLSVPQDMTFFIAEIRHAVVTKHPAIEEFLCRALEQNLIAETDALNEHVETAIYTTLILNRITEKMNNELSFMYEIKEHYIQKREEALGKKRGTLGYWWAINKNAGGLFEILKTATMDAVYDQYLGFRERGNLNRADLLSKNTGLRLNIIEAVLKDVRVGFMSNATVGWKLINSPMIDLYTEGDNNVMKQVFENDWAKVYESWNLAFVTGNLNDLHFIYPKLFIPRVVNAEEEDYLFNRGLSLWITVNVVLLRRLAGIEEVILPNAQELSDIWGKVNLEFADSIGF